MRRKKCALCAAYGAVPSHLPFYGEPAFVDLGEELELDAGA